VKKKWRQTFVPHVQVLEDRLTPALPSAAPSLGTPPAPGPNVVWVHDLTGLQNAFSNLQSGETLVIQKGTYLLTQPLIAGNGSGGAGLTNITIRGATDNFDDVLLRGAGMDDPSVGYGLYLRNVQNVTVADLSVADVYYHPIFLDSTSGPINNIHIYHDHIYDGGEQLIKSVPNGSGGGVDNSTVQYSLLEYTHGPSMIDHGGGTGYTNGIDVHTGTGWVIADNLIRNLHTPDNAQNLWNPAILIWNHSSNFTVERNTLVNNDRAIAFGLMQQSGGFDNSGGIIENNFVEMDPGLFSASRQAGADAGIIVWDSPNSKVDHNTVITNGNTPFAIEFRFTASGVEARNNLADAGIRDRDGASFTQSGNYLTAASTMFVNAAAADFHLVNNSATQTHVIGQATAVPGGIVTDDFDGNPRPTTGSVDIGGVQFSSTTAQPPTVVAPASASPGTVSGITTTLRVLGSDTAGEASLTYTWASTGTPPAAVSFSVNGTNAAKNTTITFARAGSYTFQVTLRNSAGLTATSTVTVLVNQTLTSLVLTPALASVSDGTTQQFTASARDQFGNALTIQPVFTWSLVGGLGAVDGSGLYTAPVSSTGTATVQAAIGMVTGSATVTVSPSATVPVTPPSGGNPSTPPPPDPPSPPPRHHRRHRARRLLHTRARPRRLHPRHV
jgi:hypothetical protein